MHLLDRDVRLKIWVPASVYTALTLLADAMEISRPEWVRYAFVAHAFGRLRLEQALLEKREFSAIMYSRPSFSLTEPDEERLPLGKATFDTVVNVAREVHEAITRLANDARLPIGTYASYVICWAIFGHSVHLSFARGMTAGYLLGDLDDVPALFGSDG